MRQEAQLGLATKVGVRKSTAAVPRGTLTSFKRLARGRPVHVCSVLTANAHHSSAFMASIIEKSLLCKITQTPAMELNNFGSEWKVGRGSGEGKQERLVIKKCEGGLHTPSSFVRA